MKGLICRRVLLSLIVLVPIGAAAQEPQPVPPPPPPTPVAPPAATEEPAATYPNMGKTHEINLAKDTWIKVGIQGQAWINFQQDNHVQPDGSSGSYAQDIYLRRARLLFGAQVMKNVSAFFETDMPNAGKGAAGGAKGFTPMFLQDAWVAVKFHDAFELHAGLIAVPFARNELTSTMTFIALDVGNTSAVFAGPTATSVLRDTGVQAKGFFLDSHLEYRLGLFQGVRDAPPVPPNAGSQNGFRIAGYVQYDLFDTEKGYFYDGYNLGKKKIVGFSVGGDFQATGSNNPYFGLSASAFLDWPLAGPDPKGGDAVSGLLQYLHLDGNQVLTLNQQNDLLFEVGYYNKNVNLQFFGKFEGQFFALDAQNGANTLWFGAGLRWFINDKWVNFTLAYNRAEFPNADSAVTNGTNQLTAQMQVIYY